MGSTPPRKAGRNQGQPAQAGLGRHERRLSRFGKQIGQQLTPPSEPGVVTTQARATLRSNEKLGLQVTIWRGEERAMVASMLVIDDDPEVRSIIEAYGASAGWSVEGAGTAAEGLSRLNAGTPDVVVLDVMLPDATGWGVLSAIRARSDVYVLMLTARGSESERILGLMRGADDYLVKPFSPGELLARCQALLRRPRGTPTVDGPAAASLHLGSLRIDPDQRRVAVGSRQIDLTALEFTLLLTMARHPGRVFTRGQLVAAIWGEDYDGYERVIDVHIGHIRRKLEDDPEAHRFVETVRGVGYRFVAPGGQGA